MIAKVLFINHKAKSCGVYLYGANIYNSIRKLPSIEFVYEECSSLEELDNLVNCHAPEMIIYNYHHMTLPFLGVNVLKNRLLSFSDVRLSKRYPKCSHVCLLHDIKESSVHKLKNRNFDYYIYADPYLKTDNPLVFNTGRLLPRYENKIPSPTIPTIGSYGFAGRSKGFLKVIEIVQREFDEAHIRLNIPSNDVVDVDGSQSRDLALQCRAAIFKDGIKLTVTHDFFDREGLFDFLAANSINVFPYIETKGFGIASAPDQALAVKRPIAIAQCSTMRHLLKVKPSIAIENTSLKQILANGLEPLQHLYEEWSEERLLENYEKIIKKIYERRKAFAYS